MRFGSLFSGIGGFDLGLERAGMECAWQVEIDPKAREVLRRHWPAVPHHEDVTKIGGDTLGAVDLICGGFLCQDLSVAGRRAGLAGERSGLFHEFMRVVGEIAPRWVLIENVPGLLSSNNGRDMGTVLGVLGQLGYGYAWRVLDSQYFGVPQRRRRVFIVGCAGGVCPPEVLFEPDSLPGNSPPRREARAGAAGGVGASAAETGQGWWTDDGLARLRVTTAPGQPQNVVTALRSSDGGADDNAAQGGQLIEAVQCHGGNVGPPGTLRGDGSVGGGSGYVVYRKAQRAHHAEDCERWEGAEIADTLDAAGHGPRTATAVVPASFLGQFGGGMAGGESVSHCLQASGGSDERGVRNPVIVAHTLTGEGHDAGEDGTGRGTPIVTAYALQGGGKTSQGSQGSGWKEGQAFTLNLVDTHGIASSAVAPRRLTPRECERLQAFPDDWTRYDHEGGEIADSPRYRMLGNAITVSVATWIGRRIMKASRNLGKTHG